ncbi:MAG: NAD-dependent succinate-semialdehyde dehydrogenase [Myxococcota bacterium]
MPIETRNPTTGELVQRFQPHTAAEVAHRLALAESTFQTYRTWPLQERIQRLFRAAERVEAQQAHFGALMTLEMGKPLSAAKAEAAKCATALRYYAEHGERLMAEEVVFAHDGRASIRFDPLGAILAVMPWNFPFWQVVRFAAPALLTGNVGLLKHASNVPQCALALEQLFLDAGFPPGAFQTLLIGAAEVAPLIADPRVKAVTLTGSEPAGRQVAALAGQHLKKTVLELGGSDPFVVMPSAKLPEAAVTAAKARIINNGQSCIAAKRFIVHTDVYDTFRETFLATMRAFRVGDPLDPLTDIGPMATAAIRAELLDQIARVRDAGARVSLGGEALPGPGYFLAPTVVEDLAPSSTIAQEEFFGPVALLFRVSSLEEALEVANGTTFGLGAAFWSQDEQELSRAAEALDSGLVFLNGMVASDARLPFGGVKASGYGRELAFYGLREFQNIKTVWRR